MGKIFYNGKFVEELEARKMAIKPEVAKELKKNETFHQEIGHDWNAFQARKIGKLKKVIIPDAPK